MDPRAILKSYGIPVCHNAEEWHVATGTAALYVPVTDEMVAWAESEIGCAIPGGFVAFLRQTNGLFLRDLTLFGISPSLFALAGLNRSQLEPQCITLANRDWRHEYQAPPESFMVGYIQGSDENIGLFMLPIGGILQIDSRGMQNVSDLMSVLLKVVKTPNQRMGTEK